MMIILRSISFWCLSFLLKDQITLQLLFDKFCQTITCSDPSVVGFMIAFNYDLFTNDYQIRFHFNIHTLLILFPL